MVGPLVWVCIYIANDGIPNTVPYDPVHRSPASRYLAIFSRIARLLGASIVKFGSTNPDRVRENLTTACSTTCSNWSTFIHDTLGNSVHFPQMVALTKLDKVPRLQRINAGFTGLPDAVQACHVPIEVVVIRS